MQNSLKNFFEKMKSKIFKDNRVGIIKIEGIIIETGPLPIASKFMESLKTAKNLDIKNILVRINSPGGTVGASQEIYREIKKAREEGVRIVASLGDVAASGGVYTAAAAEKIVCNPGTVTGSIGVIIKTSVIKDLYKKIGVDHQIIKSGPYKDILSNTKYLSEEEKKILQGLIDSTYRQFVDVIAENRRLSIEDVKKFSDGRIFTGIQAKEYGLIDELGSQSDAVDLIAKMAGFKEKPVIVDLTPKKTFLQKITGSTLSEILENAGINAFYRRVPLWLMSDD